MLKIKQFHVWAVILKIIPLLSFKLKDKQH